MRISLRCNTTTLIPTVGWPYYAFLAGIASFAAAGRYNRLVLWGALIVFVGVFAWHSPSLFSWAVDHNNDHLIESMAPEKPWIEESREALGALIAIIVLFVQLRFERTLRLRSIA